MTYLKYCLFVNLGILVFFGQNLAQTKSCDLRLNVFLRHSGTVPQDTPLKELQATAVDLRSNQIYLAKIDDGKPYFNNLPRSSYNILVKKNGYSDSVKTMSLLCWFVDEKNVFDETVFMINDENVKTYLTEQSGFGLSSPPPKPPLARGEKTAPDVVEQFVSFEELNDRILYLPSPVFSEEAEKVKQRLLDFGVAYTSRKLYFRDIEFRMKTIFIEAEVKVDKSGQVTEVKKIYSPTSELIPAITESVKKARFLPVKIKDKLYGFNGRVVYEIGTP